MEYLKITHSDKELISAATAIIEENYLAGKHRVGAAVRGKSGKIYTGVHLNSNAIDVCAEWVAMGIAMTNGERELDCVVATMKIDAESEPEIISPCGVCRELIQFYGKDIHVIFREDGKLRKCKARYLLPGTYVLPKPISPRARSQID